MLRCGRIKNIKQESIKQFIEFILDDSINYYHFGELENIRHQLLANQNNIEIIDLGAGSSYKNASLKKISDVAKQQLSSAHQLKIISRIIQYFESKHCVELGASLGLSSFYISKSTTGKVVSFEGNPAFVKLINYQKGLLKIQNLEIVEGNFDVTLDQYLKDCEFIDFAFIDGNHREKATLDYYFKIKEKCSSNAVLIFDDIYWSQGMENAWNKIKQDEDCRYSVDLYFMGIILIDKSIKDKKHKRFFNKIWV